MSIQIFWGKNAVENFSTKFLDGMEVFETETYTALDEITICIQFNDGFSPFHLQVFAIILHIHISYTSF